MDPAATLQAWLDAKAAPHIKRIASDYNEWIRHGGFPTQVRLKDTSPDSPPAAVERLSSRVIYLAGGSSCGALDVREVVR